MAKYDPLRRYLRRQRTPEVELSFAEIELILGAMLPNAASQPLWWADGDSDQIKAVQRAAWRDAGYEAILVAHSERVHFKRVARRAGVL